ncbi:MAG: hypothetical protein IPK82_16185 [Polyangiaceae bacterium]|nr:hypothetical protein [Polyangiaceae bacterium]
MSEPYREPPETEHNEGDDQGVHIATYTSLVEAEMAAEFLKSHTINANVAESARFNPLVNIAAGGVRLSVRAADEERARGLLRRMERAATDEQDKTDDEVRCPKCELTYCFHERGFSNPTIQQLPSAFVALAMVFAIPLGLAPKRWHCRKCEYVWDDPKAGPRTRTPLHEDDPRPTFLLKRHRAGSGLLLGFVAWGLTTMVLTSVRNVPAPLVVVPFLFPIIGFFWGRSAKTYTCSDPACRAELTADAKVCKSCRGTVAGTIRYVSQHYSESASVRRDLFKLRKEKEERAKKKAAGAKKAAKKVVSKSDDRTPPPQS